MGNHSNPTQSALPLLDTSQQSLLHLLPGLPIRRHERKSHILQFLKGGLMLRQAGERFQQTIPVELRADASDRPHAGNIGNTSCGKRLLSGLMGGLLPIERRLLGV